MTNLIEEVDSLCMEYRGEDTMVAEPEDLEWLCKQLIMWPIRVDEDKTTNMQFIMMSAARTMAYQAQIIENLKGSIKILNGQTKRLIGYPDDGGLKEPVRDFGETFSAFKMIKDHFSKPPQDPWFESLPQELADSIDLESLRRQNDSMP